MKNMRTISAILRASACLLLAHLSCAEKPTIDDFVETTISGTVTSKKDNTPIEGAAVSTQPLTTAITTNAEGLFVINVQGIELTTDYKVIVSADGFVTGEVPMKVTVGLTNGVDIGLVPLEPELQLKEDLIRFGVGEKTKFLAITNAGNALLEWEVQIAEVPWLEVLYDGNSQSATFTGSTPAEQETVLKLSVDRGAATESEEEFTTSLYINPTTGGAGREVAIEMVKELPMGELRVSPVILDFSNEASKLSLQIENVGEGDLEWRVEKKPDWVVTVPNDGSIAQGEAGISLSVDADRDDLSLIEKMNEGIIEILSSNGTQSVQVRIYVEVPTISLDGPRTIRFGALKDEEELKIENIGSGDLVWQFAGMPEWLMVEPATGVAGISASTVTLVVDRAGIAEGEYESTVTLEHNSKNQSAIELRVSVTVTAAPRLAVGSAQLEFGEDKPRLSFEIENSNNGTLDWELLPDVAWLVVDPLEGSLGMGEAVVINATVTRSGLPAGNHPGEIAISSNGGQTNVAVQMRVAQAAELLVTPEEMDFGETLVEGIVNISNIGTGELSWTVNEEIDWLAVDVAQGQSLGAETDTVMVTVRRADLEAGSHSATLTIESDGRSVPLNVSIFVGAERQLTVFPQGLDFLPHQDELSITLENSGNIALEAVVASSVEWVRVEGQHSLDPGQNIDVVVVVDRAALPIGTNEGVIRISGGEEQLELTVSIQVERAMLVTLADVVILTADSPEGHVAVSNDGNIPLLWTASLQPTLAALVLNPESGTIQPNQTTEIVVGADTSGLAGGTYESTLEIESNGGDKSIPITLQVGEHLALVLSPEGLHFGLYDSSATVSLINRGNVELAWEVESPAWARIVPDNGLIGLGDTLTVAVQLDRRDLAIDDYSGAITFTSRAGTQSLPVDMRVPGSIFAVSPLSLVFAVGQGEASLVLSNAGNIDLSWAVDGALTIPSWLELEPLKGSLEAGGESVVLLRGLRTGLKADTYTAEVSFVSGDSLLVVSVEMNVAEEPVLVVSSTEVDLGAEVSSTTLSLRNTGNAALTWEIEDPEADWLTVTPMAGALVAGAEVEGAEVEVTLSVDRDLMAPGSHSQVVSFVSGGGDHQVSVSVEVQRALLVLEQLSAEFTDQLPVQVVEIENHGNMALEWEFTNSIQWLEPSVESGTIAPGMSQEIELEMLYSEIGPGTHTASLQVSSNAGAVEILVSAIVSGDMSVYALFERTKSPEFNEAKTGDVIELQLYVRLAPEMTGWAAQFDFIETEFAFHEFVPSDFIADFNSLVDTGLKSRVVVGGVVLGFDTVGEGDGLLGTVKFVVKDGLARSGKIRMTKFSYRPPEGGETVVDVLISAVVVRADSGG